MIIGIINKIFKRGRTEWGIRIERDNKRVENFLKLYLKPNSNCIDVGAHKGSFLKLFEKFAGEGIHWAFEPLPDYFQLLKGDFQKVNLLNCALSNETGQITFYKALGAEAMSGIKPQHYPDGVRVEEISVSVKKLDDIIPGDTQIAFIKIDVEGAEYKVLDGAKKLLNRCRPVVMFEFAKTHVEQYQVTPKTMVEFFYSINYRLFRLDTVEKYDLEHLKKIFDEAHQSGYNRYAETNFLAIPSEFSLSTVKG